jgi:predicted ester cyclase
MSDLPPVLGRYIEGLEAHDVLKISGTVAANVAFITPSRTLDKPEFLAMLTALYSAFPDWRYEHDPPEARGETIAIRWRQGGTHTGTFSLPGLDPVPATGRRVRIPEQYFFYTVQAGAIVLIRPEPIAGGAPRGILEQIGHPMPPL